jgi:hypothetical protein
MPAPNSGLASVCRLTFILPTLRSGENQGRQTERKTLAEIIKNLHRQEQYGKKCKSSIRRI